MADIEIHITDGHDPRFAALCLELDAYLNELVGGEAQRSHYAQYNLPEAITDVLLMLSGGQAIACAGFKRYADGTAEVKRVYMRPGFRKQGLSRRMMQALQARATAQGYTRFILETGRMMAPAIGFYTSLGFTRIENYGQYRDLPDSVCFEKRLA